jgi:hypothetical protein
MAKKSNVKDLSFPPGEEMMSVLSDILGIPHAEPAPDRNEGEGPYKRLVLRGGMLIDGTGAPMHGPTEIVIEGDRVTEIRSGSVLLRTESGDCEIDLKGKYILPGFIEAHAHIGNPLQGIAGSKVVPAEYVYKLYMAHGVTTLRECGALMGLDWTLNEQNNSERNLITAPRIVTYPVMWPPQMNHHVDTPDKIRTWVKEISNKSITGIKYFGGSLETSRAFYEETKALGLRTACHHYLRFSAQVNPVHAARMGLTSMEHHYGLPWALCSEGSVYPYPLDHNDSYEPARFLEDGRMWKHTEPGGDRWNEVIDVFLATDFTLVPTMTIYEAARDVSRARNAEWHKDYTLPSLWEFYQPSPISHGSFYIDYTTADELDWKENFQYWMCFLNDFKDRGGRVAAGSDAGFIYKQYGFDYIREFEMLQEAGFHPLEVIRSATQYGAELLGLEKELGTVQVGKRADLVITDENPLTNFKLLYGTGHECLNQETGKVDRVGGVRWTIKDGIIYDAKALLADVREMVASAKTEENEK